MKFLKKYLKDIIYIVVITSLAICTTVLFLTKQNLPKTIYGITIESNSGIVKSYHIDCQDRYNFILENTGIIASGNLIKEITIEEQSKLDSTGTEKSYKIYLTEYDGDVTTIVCNWSKIYHIEYL